MMRMLDLGRAVVVGGGRMMRMLGPGLPGGSRGAAGGWEVVALPSLLACWGLGGASFPSHSRWSDWRWWGWGGVGLEEGVRSLLARVP